jgi:CBS domain-containing protein
MKVGDVMSRGVISVAPETSLQKAARLMLRYDLSGFPVLNHGKLVGIVTEGDFLRRAEIGTERRHGGLLDRLAGPGPMAADYVSAHGRSVGEVMTRNVITIGEDAPLEQAATQMQQHHVKRLPVVKNEAVIGIVSRTNLIHAYLVGCAKESAAPLDDVAIRARLHAELDSQPWAPHRSVHATVEHGVVDLHGLIRDERQRAALRVAAENIPGVKEVRDHLRLLDPGMIG